MSCFQQEFHLYSMCLRVYACFMQDTDLKAYPWIEIYDGCLIKYMAPLELYDQFFVPEAVAAANDLTAAADGGGGDGDEAGSDDADDDAGDS